MAPQPALRVQGLSYAGGAWREGGRIEGAIAQMLNREGQVTDLGRPWSRGTVHEVLTNPKYVGDNVFNRVSFKLRQRRVTNPEKAWVRAAGAFAAVVAPALQRKALAIIAARSLRLSDQELLDQLKTLLGEVGALSSLVIDECDQMPSISVYCKRFGSLMRAYQLVGYDPGRDYAYVEIIRELRRRHPEAVEEVSRAFAPPAPR